MANSVMVHFSKAIIREYKRLHARQKFADFARNCVENAIERDKLKTGDRHESSSEWRCDC